jgi:hypothetical protein
MDTQIEMEHSNGTYVMPRYITNDFLDMNYLLKDFQAFWRENSGIWKEKYDYKEAAPHLILQAFLQRVLNGGGQIIREMAAPTRRADLCVIYMDKKYPIELKIKRVEHTYRDGITQLAGYMDTLGCETGWLILFDNTQTSWEERLFTSEEKVDGKTIYVYGM